MSTFVVRMDEDGTSRINDVPELWLLPQMTDEAVGRLVRNLVGESRVVVSIAAMPLAVSA